MGRQASLCNPFSSGLVEITTRHVGWLVAWMVGHGDGRVPLKRLRKLNSPNSTNTLKPGWWVLRRQLEQQRMARFKTQS